MAGFWIDIEDSSGNKLGDGPLITATQWQQVKRLDRAGEFSTRVSQTEPMFYQLHALRTLRCMGANAPDLGLVEYGAGIVNERRGHGKGGGDVSADISGSDLLRELTYRNVGELAIDNGSGGATNSGPQLIMAYAPPGWSLDTVNGWDTTATAVLHQFSGESVLEALGRLAEMTGEHFRLTDGRKILWMRSDQPSSGIVAVQDGETISLGGNTQVVLFTTLDSVEDVTEVATRITPYGAGDGDARLTLAGATWSPPAGYSIDTVNNVITSTVAENPVSFPGVRIDAQPQHWKDITDANTLAEAAYQWLRKRGNGDEYRSYRIRLSKIDTVLEPGTTIRIIYQRYIDQNSADWPGGIYPAVVVDDDFLILEVTNIIDANGARTAEIVVASTDRWPASEAEMILNGLGESTNAYTHTQPVDPGEITGTLTPAQYPDALLRDGSRSLLGDLAVTAGKTIDGVDISALSTNYTAHLTSDSHPQYLHTSIDRTTTALITFDAGSARAPFALSYEHPAPDGDRPESRRTEQNRHRRHAALRRWNADREHHAEAGERDGAIPDPDDWREPLHPILYGPEHPGRHLPDL